MNLKSGVRNHHFVRAFNAGFLFEVQVRRNKSPFLVFMIACFAPNVKSVQESEETTIFGGPLVQCAPFGRACTLFLVSDCRPDPTMTGFVFHLCLKPDFILPGALQTSRKFSHLNGPANGKFCMCGWIPFAAIER